MLPARAKQMGDNLQQCCRLLWSPPTVEGVTKWPKGGRVAGAGMDKHSFAP